MSITELCIRRPVLATVLNLVIVLIGLISLQSLSIREYPNIDSPVVTVISRYQGASASIIETQVTNVIEDALSGIEGVDYVSSISRSEQSQITIRFLLDRDPDAAASDVRDRVGRAGGLLPREVDDPIIAKVEADADPIIYLAFSTDRYSALDLTEFIETLAVDQVQALPGVANVQLIGARRYAMRIWLDRARMAAFGVTAQDVEQALREQNIEVPSGRIESVDREYSVVAQTDLALPREFEKVILRDANGYMVRLEDVAKVELGPEGERQLSQINGRQAVAFGVVKQSTANPLDVSKVVTAAMPDILAGMPEGVDVRIGYDTTVFITESIKAVYFAIAEAIVLVSIVVFVFLHTARATIIPLVTIPVSLIGSLAIMSFLGFSINTLTLLAFVLAIGLVVDDAIVMLENIYRQIERGMAPTDAAIKGSKQITFAIIAMSTTLAAVFFPVSFASGTIGKLFTEFALTLAGAVLVSGFTALTLTPMMCSRFLRPEGEKGVVTGAFDSAMNGMSDAYRVALSGALKMRGVVVVGIAIIAAFAGYLFFNLKQELTPIEDRGLVITAQIGPEGATPEYMLRNAQKVETIIEKIPEIEIFMTMVGFPVSTVTSTFSTLIPWEERDRKSYDIAEIISPQVFAIPGIFAFATVPPTFGSRGGTKQIEVVVRTTGSYEDLEQLTGEVFGLLGPGSGIRDLDTNLRLNKPELRTTVNREKAVDIGVSVATIGRTLETLLGGREVTRFKRSGEQYDVIVQIDESERSDPRDLARLFVRGHNDAMVPLANLVQFEETVAPRELVHFNRLRAVTISANVDPGMALGEALTLIEKTVRDVARVPVQIDYSGVSREFKDASGRLALVFVLAIAFIYLVLAAQFESFIDPFIILISVPLAIAGALFALTVTGGSLNVYSQLGLITLIGLISKHGILIVEFANSRRAQGMNKMEAALESAVLRLRPILMTTGAMVLGAVPLALATGAGAESREQVGIVIVGGLIFGSFFTLFVVPVVYTLLSRERRALPGESFVSAPAE
ncbi:MAG: efflux RND transporter permease subunit [Rhodospirillaceae bacterium]|nr:efflux RND transporter permease subunit [Rhodospirillaceae bacterium]MBT5242103.1 efflux RND transporter permease subunit [Rhodospirillaceae bacterium]MBT5565829.1 efflux RND transporter permease subunit [Rhodospirillaceae bacterium]MBT6090278.1 efflux RND transporter permease subunit [Rhodospirillaceae bacterium]MBT7451894.1 efflux RND transporter permease subunit [Rhodospirillaceae bacterium]